LIFGISQLIYAGVNMGVSRVSVDLNSRSFEIEVPDENLSSVLKMLESLFSNVPPVAEVKAERSAPEAPLMETDAPEDAGPEKVKRKRGKGTGKVRPLAVVDLGLSTTQRQELQKHFTEKAPVGQNDQVAVLAVKIKEMTGKTQFSGDDIHSAFKIVNRPTPRNLVAVMGNMKRDGKAGYSENQLQVTHYTEDHVHYHMKKPEKTK
jgi:hypothetical protein